MNSNKKTTGIMLDVRIILAVLWIAGMLSSLNGDTYRLSDPIALKSILANNASITITPELFLVMSMIFVVPIFMSVLTLTLKYPVSRWANRVLGILYALINLANCVASFVVQPTGYGVVWSTAGLVFALLVVWHAWKWPKQEA